MAHRVTQLLRCGQDGQGRVPIGWAAVGQAKPCQVRQFIKIVER